MATMSAWPISRRSRSSSSYASVLSIGCAIAVISEIERGRKQPTLALIDRYAAEFGIPRSSILFFAEGLEHPSKSANAAPRGRGAIARKVIHFLRLIEERTGHAEKV